MFNRRPVRPPERVVQSSVERKIDKTEEVALVPKTTVRKIRYGVVIGHVALVVVPLAVATILAWIVPKEPRITVALYDPALDKVVENPSPVPSPDNPVPPSGTPDAAPPEQPAPEPDPTPQVNYNLPSPIHPQPKVKVTQPKIKPIVRPRSKPKNRPKPETADSPPDPRRRVDDVKPVNADSRTSGRSGNSGARGSNSEEGHTAPGGERGNSGYDIQVAMMIERMWITPESVRLGGREPRVLIELEIDPSGRVAAKRILTKSGVLAMDESVAALLDNLYRVKPPFDGKSHALTFWLKARRD